MTSRTITGLVSIAVAAMALSPVAAASATAPPKKPFDGKICALVNPGQLAASHIDVPCAPLPPRTIAGGSLQALVFSAHWGDSPSLGHWLSITVQKLRGSAKQVVQAQKEFRKSVLKNGAEVPVGSLGSVSTHRGKGLLLAMRHGYNVVISLNDDDPAASQTTIKAALISIGKAIAAKL